MDSNEVCLLTPQVGGGGRLSHLSVAVEIFKRQDVFEICRLTKV